MSVSPQVHLMPFKPKRTLSHLKSEKGGGISKQRRVAGFTLLDELMLNQLMKV